MQSLCPKSTIHMQTNSKFNSICHTPGIRLSYILIHMPSTALAIVSQTFSRASFVIVLASVIAHSWAVPMPPKKKRRGLQGAKQRLVVEKEEAGLVVSQTEVHVCDASSNLACCVSWIIAHVHVHLRFRLRARVSWKWTSTCRHTTYWPVLCDRHSSSSLENGLRTSRTSGDWLVPACILDWFSLH